MRGVDPEQLEKACRRLGEAAVDPAMWPEIMEEICQGAGAAGAALLQSDVRTPDIPRTASIDELTNKYFKEGWHERDVRGSRGMPLALAGDPVFTDQDVVTPDELQRTPFYNELIIPCGFYWFAALAFRAGSASWALAMQRTPQQGAFSERDKRVLRLISPKLTEVATLSTAVGRIALASATNALNAVFQAAVAIDRFGFVLDANAAAEAIFDPHICVTNRRLVVDDPAAKRSLNELINRLRVTSETETLACDPIVIRRKGKVPVIAPTLPVHGAARTPFLGARVLLTLTVVQTRPGPQPALLARIFGLTPAEARLAAVIAGGLSPEQAAEGLGISTVTARNQLRAIFAKTDTHRQGELVALLSRLGR